MRSKTGARAVRGRRGQALAEMGIVLTVLIFLSLGIMEFGRAWMIVNMMTAAGRDAARSAATLGPGSRFSSGANKDQIDTSSQGWQDIEDAAIAEIASVYVDGTDPVIVLNPDAAPGGSTVPMISVTVQKDVDWLFLGFIFGSDTFTVDRQITFRDEGRL